MFTWGSHRFTCQSMLRPSRHQHTWPWNALWHAFLFLPSCLSIHSLPGGLLFFSLRQKSTISSSKQPFQAVAPSLAVSWSCAHVPIITLPRQTVLWPSVYPLGFPLGRDLNIFFRCDTFCRWHSIVQHISPGIPNEVARRHFSLPGQESGL